LTPEVLLDWGLIFSIAGSVPVNYNLRQNVNQSVKNLRLTLDAGLTREVLYKIIIEDCMALAH